MEVNKLLTIISNKYMLILMRMGFVIIMIMYSMGFKNNLAKFLVSTQNKLRKMIVLSSVYK